jgi:hypothetical protein
MRENVDLWAAKQDDHPGRSEAIRRLVELGLTVKPKARSRGSEQQKERAREMAGKAIDRKSDTTAPADAQAGRKRRLLKGPEEFRDSRVDRKTKK